MGLKGFFGAVKNFGRRALSVGGETVRKFGDLVGKAANVASAVSPHISGLAGVVASRSDNPAVRDIASKIAYGTGMLGSMGRPAGHLIGEVGKFMKASGDGTGYAYTPLA